MCHSLALAAGNFRSVREKEATPCTAYAAKMKQLSTNRCIYRPYQMDPESPTIYLETRCIAQIRIH